MGLQNRLVESRGTAAERLRTAFVLYDFAEALVRKRLRREHPVQAAPGSRPSSRPGARRGRVPSTATASGARGPGREEPDPMRRRGRGDARRAGTTSPLELALAAAARALRSARKPWALIGGLAVSARRS